MSTRMLTLISVFTCLFGLAGCGDDPPPVTTVGGDAATGGDGDAGTSSDGTGGTDGTDGSTGGSASSSGGCCAPMGGGEPLGTCLPEDVVSSTGGGGADVLPQDTCEMGSVCVPQQFIQDPNAGLKECTSESMGKGGCVPECFEMVPAGALPQGDCQNGEACVSCGLLGSATSRVPDHCSSGDAGTGGDSNADAG